MDDMPLLFSYGTLQQENVQLSTFGRRLDGQRDELLRFEPSLVRIDDPRIAASIGRTHHANVTFNGNEDSRVPGMVFDVTDAELARVDEYETPFLYKRVAAVLASGRQAWVYVHATGHADHTSGGDESRNDHALIETSRLVLRRPLLGDASAMFERYAGDPEVTRFVGWPRHLAVDDTLAFLQLSDAQWERWRGGPYLIVSRVDGRLLGSTGLGFEAPDRAETGYVLAKDSWGQGYATEALQAMVALARHRDVVRLYAVCHPDHRASQRVLEKCDFKCEGAWRDHAEFPNLTPGVRSDVLCYALTFGSSWRNQEAANG